MKKLWKNNDGFRLLVWCLLGFALIVLIAHAIEIKSGYRDRCRWEKTRIGIAVIQSPRA